MSEISIRKKEDSGDAHSVFAPEFGDDTASCQTAGNVVVKRGVDKDQIMTGIEDRLSFCRAAE